MKKKLLLTLALATLAASLCAGLAGANTLLPNPGSSVSVPSGLGLSPSQQSQLQQCLTQKTLSQCLALVGGVGNPTSGGGNTSGGGKSGGGGNDTNRHGSSPNGSQDHTSHGAKLTNHTPQGGANKN